MRLQDAFHSTFLHHGGRLRLPDLGDNTSSVLSRTMYRRTRTSLRQTASVLQSQYPSIFPRPVYADLIANPGANAAVNATDSADFIGIFGGLLVQLYSLFQNYLSHPDVLPFLGNNSCPSQELNPGPSQRFGGLALGDFRGWRTCWSPSIGPA